MIKLAAENSEQVLSLILRTVSHTFPFTYNNSKKVSQNWKPDRHYFRKKFSYLKISPINQQK